MMLGLLVGNMVLAVGNMKPAQMMTWMVSFPWMLLLFFLFRFLCWFMLWSVDSFLTDAECADQGQWISSTIHEPKEWSVFGQPIRTNNDLKGWHHALNRRTGRSHLPFYELVELLHNEARVCELSIKLISSGKLKGIQKRKYRNLQRKIFDLWEKFENNEKSAVQLLKACSAWMAPLEVSST